jgi:RHS repeat-associated protein
VTKSTLYTYNLDGSIATLVYPSVRTITYTPSGAARSLSAIDTANSINYATAAHYAPQGALSSLANGANLISTLYYSNRLQPCRISVKNTGTAPATCTDAATGNVLDFSYNFSLGASDNGNVTAITNNRDTTRSQSFTYDSLNRISVGETTSTFATSPAHCWGEQFAYDAWGNLSTISGASSAYTGCTQESLSVTPANNNQVSGFCYDAAGNLLAQSAPPCPAPTYNYNAENQMTLTAGVTYTYDGDGKRVKKSSGKLYWYGMGSDPLDETDLVGNTNNASFNKYIFFAGKRIARRDFSNNVNYYFADHLGTARVVASATGTVLDDSDFYPFGGERVYANSSPQNYKFTGKERDTESGNDYFGARYYASSVGRFLSPDWSAKIMPVPYAKLGDPQTLNLYAYVQNNPLTRFDPDGHCADHYDNGSCKVNVDPATGKAGANAGKQLEGVLNKYDKAINALSDKSKFDIKDSKGNVTGSLTGKEIKAVWNGTSFTVTDKSFNNGGAGGGTGGTWKGDSFSGHSDLNPGAVSAYANAASARNEAPLVGLSTLTFHELGHETHFGEALTGQYPVTPTISWARERGASSAGSQMAQTVGAPFDCSIPGGCQ